MCFMSSMKHMKNLQVKLADEEYERLQRQAALRGQSLQEYGHTAIMGAVNELDLRFLEAARRAHDAHPEVWSAVAGVDREFDADRATARARWRDQRPEWSDDAR